MITKDDFDEFVFDYRVSLPEPVARKILQLIQQDDVRSVSCNFDDPELWRKLIAEQVLSESLAGMAKRFGLLARFTD
jgi:hypothetical protein